MHVHDSHTRRDRHRASPKAEHAVTTTTAADQALPPPTPFQQVVRMYHATVPVFEQFVGVSLARWRVLTQLEQHGSLNQSELKQRIQVDPAAITRQVQQLEEEGLVERRTNPDDNRFTVVTLTPQGREVAETILNKRDQFEAEVLRGTDPSDIAAMQRCLTQMRENLSMLSTKAAN